jgi:hypothetical protein
VTDEWISVETEQKERDFYGIFNMHVPICKGIISRHLGDGPYFYGDLYAGPGHLEFNGRQFLGSPLIAQEILTRHGVPYQAVHFEKDPAVAARLGEALWVPVSLLDMPDPESAQIRIETCQEGFPRWLAEIGPQPRRLGMVYADPIRDEIPVELLNCAAKFMPRVDLLSYVSATQYKRRRRGDLRRNGHSARPVLSDHVNAVNKRHGLIRKPEHRTGWQFTFILWSNWGNLPDWNGRGFYRLDSDEGRRILDLLDLTSDEQHEKANTPLWSEGDGVLPARYQPPRTGDAPYRNYQEYLRHPRFLAIRAQVFERAGGKCERCGLRPPTEPHHLRYPPWGAFDVPENMIAVCHPCHCEIHGEAT